MKLKEAQLLGVLAIIAAGIIVVSMLGGDGKGADVSSPDAQTHNPQATRTTNDGLDDWVTVLDLDEGVEDANPQTDDPDEVDVEGTESEDIELIRDEDPEPVPVPAAPKIHVVQTGDRLIAISRKYYNTPTRWRIILEANKHLISAPEDLRPGMKLVIPAPPAPTPADAGAEGQAAVLSSRTIPAGARSYDVEEGDTLWIIAEKVYNKPADWPKLMAANADILSDPKDLRPGMRLIVP